MQVVELEHKLKEHVPLLWLSLLHTKGFQNHHPNPRQVMANNCNHIGTWKAHIPFLIRCQSAMSLCVQSKNGKWWWSYGLKKEEETLQERKQKR
ncbi:hypothetical protein ERO13_A07G058766v2 [Gossypium hirsutum]|uniref:Uncharacterized protein n=3 Tax=Gossypium TaxID=3633 RepID=A0A5J5V0I8_GOSBA|nr:hypothetical protein ES319_A07G066000v1 [Gossypium barbadense]KAG4190910.1 hypothetical protein ERO13_A07G058766v2 [Gossypium hirsutum]TYH09101.1 hypothetical protein ES288_A07G068900v1 [Gossypium darwinii]TYI18120.1 hypothetical protein ES332_A07G069200v1 [Gossypium tomentosum]